MITTPVPMPSGALPEPTPPCLSLYQSTHRSFPENRQDRLRFKNLVGTLEASLRSRYPGREIAPLVAPFRELEADDAFWNHTLEGLAVFASPGFFRTYRFEASPRECAVAADTFHTKPLLRIMQLGARVHILALSRQRFRLFEADRYAIEEIELPADMPRTMLEALGVQESEPHVTMASFGPAGSGGTMRHGHSTKQDEEQLDDERFFRAVDQAVDARYSRPSGLPVMLAALSQHQGLFRKLSRNARLMAQGIEADPGKMPNEELRRRAWEILEPAVQADLAQACSEYVEAFAKGAGTDDIEAAALAAVEGRVGTLLLDRDMVRPGRIDEASGSIRTEPLDDPGVDDLLDDLGELVLRKGGRVLVVDSLQMPTLTGLAATFRY